MAIHTLEEMPRPEGADDESGSLGLQTLSPTEREIAQLEMAITLPPRRRPVAQVATREPVNLIREKISLTRRLGNHTANLLVWGFFILALLPLGSLLYTVAVRGAARFDAEFFNSSMRGILGPGGGALHAIVGTVLITLAAVVISVPIGLLCAIYLVEYGVASTGKPTKFAKMITFLVDVMTGVPSIVAGLFAYALFSMILGPGSRSGLAGAVALSLLMIPVVVRGCEEMLRLVSDDLREAAYALGTPKYRVITTIVLPTAISGIVASVMLGIARIVGETAPLLLVAGFTDSMNYSLTNGRIATLPVFIYGQWANKGADAAAYDNRAWTAALVLIGFVLILNITSRIVARIFAPKTR
jgi:phosphate transport system permease protein